MTTEPTFDGVVEHLQDYVRLELDEGRGQAAVAMAALEALRAQPVHAAASTHIPAGTSPHDGAAADVLAALAGRIADCTLCCLHEKRHHTVPGEGPCEPEVMFVGEGPGAEEDAQGRPFVGRAGVLLTRMIQAMGFSREEVFIGNVVKCRPPDNRTPAPDEMETCLPYLREQIAVLRPKVIVALGGTAMHGLLGLKQGITRVRGQWFSFDDIDVMPTYHPAYLLRNPSAKRDAWDDLKAVLARLGREPPPVRTSGRG